MSAQSERLLPALPRQQVTRGFAKDGGLLAYQSKEIDLYRQSASYVDKILKGAKPADLNGTGPQ
jgi:putative ABC transport system substrate-binding protein